MEVPTVKPDEIDPLSSGEVKKLLSVNDQWTPIFTLLVYTGIKITLDLYVHTNTERLRDATNILDQAING